MSVEKPSAVGYLQQKKKWLHGKAVVNGELRFLSVSAMEKGDNSKPNGCLRRWYYQYIGGIKEPQSDAMERGEKLHAEIAHYLKTGEKVLSSQVMAGMHMIPDPGDDLLVEHDIIPQMPDGKSGLKHAVLKASGIPIVGAIDLIHARGINKGTMDIESTRDPEGTIEVIDWKTCRTLNHAKPGPELMKSIQMVGYGKYVFDAEPEAKLVRLSHGYFPSQGTPRKTTIRADREQIEKAWEHSNRVASSIRDAAKEINPDLVEANTQACRAYGKECPAIKQCSAVKNNVMAKFVGQVLSSQLIPAGNLTKKMETPPNNSILAQIKAKQAQSNLPEPRPNRGVFGSIGVQVTPPSNPHSSPGERMGLAGPSSEQEEIERLKAELAAREEALKSKPQHDLTLGPELVPPDVPESNPVLASKPVENNAFSQAMAEVVEVAPDAPVEVVVEKKKRGPKGPRKKSVHVLEQSTSGDGGGPTLPERDLPPPITQEEILAQTELINKEITTPHPVFGSVSEVVPVQEAINLYVDCDVDGIETESLWPLIDHICEQLSLEAKVRDFRVSKELDFGKWKGALAACIRITPILGGNYTLKHAHTDIGQVVVETLRSIVRASGGVMVIGAK